ncbi:MAG: chemotaxis protein CheW, partial [Stenotrophomonas sp.]
GDALLDELDAAFDQARADYQSGQAAAPLTAPQPASTARRIPPAPLGPPVLAARSSPAVPVWQAAGAPAGHAPANHEPRRRASERSSRWLRLRCGQQPYALELLKVQEVVLLAPLLSLRGTAPHMLGIMNLRGQVVPVMDLGLYLGAEPAAEDAATRIVVLESEGQSLGLRVSAVDDVASLSESQIEPPDTARLCRFSNHLFRGVARLGGPPIILLDANALLN